MISAVSIEATLQHAGSMLGRKPGAGSQHWRRSHDSDQPDHRPSRAANPGCWRLCQKGDVTLATAERELS
jgi:hypothetical protein